MAPSNITYQKVSIKYGIFVGIAHIVYFLLMRLFGLQQIIELSFLSALFLIIGIVVAISNYKKALKGHINYLKGLAIGATVGVVSSSLLAVFLVIYISIFDSVYLDLLQASYLFPQSLTVLSLFVLAIVYGTWPGFLIAFVAMQWFKEADHTMTEKV
jgi:hypothetical protein